MGSKVPVTDPLAEEGIFSRLVAELRQWHVFRIAATYGVVVWLLVQVVATVGPAFDLPGWVLRAVVLASIFGFLATMGFLLFRPRSAGKGRLPIYLSKRARLIAGVGVLAVAAAIRNDGRTLEWLDKAIQRHWLGQYYSSQLADWPQFDAFRSNPRYIAIQKRIDAAIARERAEVLAAAQ